MRRAFTMVEMLVAMALLILLVSLGIGMSMNTLKMKKFQAVYDGLLADLQMARSNAVSGKKDNTQCLSVGVNPNVLKWWSVVISSGSYVVQGVCTVSGSDTTFFTKTVNFSGVTITPATTINFKPLGLGTNLTDTLTIGLNGFSSKSITVFVSGEIQ